MKEENTFIGRIALSRKNLVELIVVVVLLSFGINLIADQLLNWLREVPVVIVLFGTLFCLVPITYTLMSLFGTRVKETTFKAFLAYDPIKKEPVFVERYELSERIHEYITAAFAENAALKIRWEKQPLEPYTFTVVEHDGSSKQLNHEELSKLRWPLDETDEAMLPADGRFTISCVLSSAKENDTVKLFVEAMEYFLLEKLSMHLSGYFYKKKISRKNLTEYGRSDIPAILLSNTFLELFSRPMSERPAFVESKDENVTESISFASGGHRYSKFRLVLPKGSRVKRPSDHKIEIETKKVKIGLAVRFEGAVAGLPHTFGRYYLGITNLFDLFTYTAYIDIHISVKLGAMFSNAGWDYYQWVDSFLEEFDKSVSEEAFFHRINWESTQTLLQCFQQMPHTVQGKSQKSRKANSVALKSEP